MPRDIYHSLNYDHDEINHLLDLVQNGQVLTNDEYKELKESILVLLELENDFNEFVANLEIPDEVRDLKDFEDYYTKDIVDRMINNAVDSLAARIDWTESESELAFATKIALENQAETLKDYIKDYVDNRFRNPEFPSYAKKSELLLKADERHTHELEDIRGIEEKLDKANEIAETFKIALDGVKHDHGNKDVLDQITMAKLQAWDNFLDEAFKQLAFKADIVHNHDTLYACKHLEHAHNNLSILDSIDAATLKALGNTDENTIHSHSNMSVLNSITQEKIDLWDQGGNSGEDSDEPWDEGRVTSKEVGGIPAGTNLDGKTMREIISMMLYPDIAPKLSINLDNSPSGSIFEVGTTVTLNEITASVTKTSNDIKSVTLYESNTAIEAVTDIQNTNNNMTFSWDINKDITSSMAAGHYKVIVEDIKGKTVSASTKAINFYNPMYYGVVNSNVGVENITESIVLAFNGKIIEAKGNKAVSFTTSAERMVFAYPKEYGPLSSIVDPNRYDIIKSFDMTTLTIKNVEYYVYMNNANTSTNFKLEFIF